jgi:hypothetical protein
VGYLDSLDQEDLPELKDLPDHEGPKVGPDLVDQKDLTVVQVLLDHVDTQAVPVLDTLDLRG